MANRKKTAQPAAPLEPIRTEAADGCSLIHLEGVVGVAQAKRLQALAMETAAAGRAVRVRCEHLQHLDCAAVQVLLALNENLKASGTELSLDHLPDSVQRTLRIAGLASAL